MDLFSRVHGGLLVNMNTVYSRSASQTSADLGAQWMHSGVNPLHSQNDKNIF